MEQKSIIYPIFLPAIPSRNFFAKVRKIFDIYRFFRYFFLSYCPNLYGCPCSFPKFPFIPHSPVSSRCLTVMAFVWFPSSKGSKNLTVFWKRCRGSDGASKTGRMGFESLKTFDSFPGVHSVRWVATDGDGCHGCDGIWGGVVHPSKARWLEDWKRGWLRTQLWKSRCRSSRDWMCVQ